MCAKKWTRAAWLAALLMLPRIATAQKPLADRLVLSIEPRAGFVAPHHDYIAYFLRHNVAAFRLNVGLQTDGTKDWHIRFRYPVIGLGYYRSNLGNSQHFGNLHGLYTYFDNHFLTPQHRLNVGHRISFGLSYATKHYHAQRNPQHFVLSTAINVFFQYDLLLRYQATQNLSFALMTGITHASNGNLREPNKGFNIITAGLEARYSLKPLTTLLSNTPPTKSDTTRLALLVGIMGGAKTIAVGNNHLYASIGISTELQYRIGHASIVGIEVDAYRDNSTRLCYIDRHRTEDGFRNGMYYRMAIYPTYIIHAGRLGISLQPGIYINRTTLDGRFTYKLGLRWQMLRDVYASIAIKTHYFGNADFIELGLRYRFRFI